MNTSQEEIRSSPVFPEIPLFSPNNHSEWRITYRSASPEVSEYVAARVMRRFSSKAESVEAVEELTEAGVHSRNYKVTVQKEGARSHLLLRQYPAERDTSVMFALAEILESMKGNNLRIPRIIPTDSGETVFQDDGTWCMAYEFIHGEHFRGTLQELESAGTHMGKLYRVLSLLSDHAALHAIADFHPEIIARRLYTQTDWELLFAKAEEFQEREKEEFFHIKLLSERDRIMAIIKETDAYSTEPWPMQVGHFDLHPHNILTNGIEVTAIIDLDSLRYLERARTIAFALHRLVRQYVVHEQPADVSAAIHQAARVFLSAYEKESECTREERGALAYFIRAEAMARLTRIAKDLYLHSITSWKTDIDKQILTCKESEFFEDL